MDFLFNKLRNFNKIFNISNLAYKKRDLSPKNNTTQNESEKPKRLFKYDNLKGLAIILVVMFHLINPFTEFGIYNSLRQLIAIVAMPLLFFISGYFSKVTENSEEKAFRKIFIPYIIFDTLWILFTVIILGSDFPSFPYIIPARGLWYLLILFWLRLFLPIIAKIKHVLWITIALAILIALISFDNNFLAFAKGLYYAPFFILGFYFKNPDIYLKNINSNIKNTLFKIKDFIIKHKIIMLAVFLILSALVMIIVKGFPSGFFSFEHSYVQLKIGRKIGMLMRLFTILVGFAFIIILNYIMTDKKTFLTKLGANSLAIYILHFYITRLLDIYVIHSEIGDFIRSNILFSSIYAIAVASIILFVLSRDSISLAINKLTSYFENLIMTSSNKSDK